MITYEGQLHSSKYLLQAFGTTDIRYLVVFPLYHVSGFSTFLAIFLGGGQIGLLENADSVKLLEGFQKYRPNAFGMVPKVYETFQQKVVEQINSRKFGKVILKLIDVSGWFRRYLNLNIGRVLFKSMNRQLFGGNMKYLGVGGGLVTEEVSSFFQKLGYRWMNTYASTELNLPMATTTSKDNYPVNSVGNIKSFNGIDVRIQNPDSAGRGEIQIKSTCRMKGYFRDAESTRKAYEEDYFKTGDIGYIDKRGYLYVTGRSKESIHLQNGEKVSPERIEALYSSCIPENVVAACSGVKNEKKGYDDIVYFVEKSSLSDEMALKHKIMEQSKRIGGNYRIKEVCFIDKMPLSSIGKVQRYKLQNMDVKKQETSQNTAEEKEHDIYTRMVQILKEVGVTENISKDSILEQDLGLDSLNLFELCVAIENGLHVSLYDCISSQLTVKELCELVENGTGSMSTINYDMKDFPMRHYKKDRIFLSVMSKLTRLCYSFETYGLENIPQNGPFIICSNHQSHLDSMWIIAAAGKKIDLEQFCCMAKQEHLEHRSSRKWLRILGGIPVDRSGNSSPAMKRCAELLKNGKIVLIHPEGTRTDTGRMGEFKAGFEKLAIESQSLVLPVKIDGAYEIFPKYRKLPHLFSTKGKYKLSVHFFEPICPREGCAKHLQTLIEQSAS